MPDWGEGRVQAGGRSLEYRCWGDAPRDGYAIVLLHEGLGSVALWRGFPQRLSEVTGLPVLAYSRAGYGASEADDLPRPLDWMTREAGVLQEVVQGFGLTQPIMVGHSDGATIAAIAAGTLLRSRVVAAVLMAPHFFTEEMGLAEIARADAGFDKSGLAERMAKYHSDPVATFRGWSQAWLSPDFKAWTVVNVLDSIPAPVLVIQGRQDQYGTLAQVDAVTARVETATALVLDDCQHQPHLEQMDVVLGAIGYLLHNNAYI